MPGCYAPDCNHVSLRDSCRFFTFPKDETKFNEWAKICRRGDRPPNKNDRLCSCHFKEGIKDNGPTIFNRNKNDIFTAVSKQQRKRKTYKEELSEALYKEVSIEVPIKVLYLEGK